MAWITVISTQVSFKEACKGKCTTYLLSNIVEYNCKSHNILSNDFSSSLSTESPNRSFSMSINNPSTIRDCTKWLRIMCWRNISNPMSLEGKKYTRITNRRRIKRRATRSGPAYHIDGTEAFCSTNVLSKYKKILRIIIIWRQWDCQHSFIFFKNICLSVLSPTNCLMCDLTCTSVKAGKIHSNYLLCGTLPS